jgi:O-antigen/teichoic acid export membrane protein
VIKYLFSILNKKIGWSFLSGLSSGALLVIVTPFYISNLGLDGYGIIGIFLMLQALIALLDFGLGASITRVLSDSQENKFNLFDKQRLLFTAEILCWFGALAFFIMVASGSNLIAVRWINSETASYNDVFYSFILIGVALALQFPGNLYINALLGLQNHKVLSLFQIFGNLMRYGGGAAILVWHPNILYFFAVQICASAIQTISMKFYIWHIAFRSKDCPIKFSFESIVNLWKYSIGMSATAIISALIANSDRLILSNMVSLTEIGSYSAALTAASVVSLFILPFYRVFYPRFSELFFSGRIDILNKTYLSSCEVLSAFVVPVILCGILCAPELLRLWLGHGDPITKLSFQFLIFGIGLSGLLWLPASIVQAVGHPRVHLLMMSLGLVLGIPFSILGIQSFGPSGASLIWIVHGFIGISLEIWLIQKFFIKSSITNWYFRVLVLPVFISLSIEISLYYLIKDKVTDLTFIFIMGLASVFAAAIGIAILSFMNNNSKKSWD